jgi:hypothetical protein
VLCAGTSAIACWSHPQAGQLSSRTKSWVLYAQR